MIKCDGFIGVFKKKSSYHRCYWCLPRPHKLAALLLLCYTGFLFFPLPSLSIFSSPAGQGSPAAARPHSSLPTFSSTCSYLAEPSGILKAWRWAICCLALHHFMPDPSSPCLHTHFFLPDLNHQLYRKRWCMCWNRQIPEKSPFSCRGWLCGLNHSRTDVVFTGRVTDNCQLKSSGLFWLTRIYAWFFSHPDILIGIRSPVWRLLRLRD